MKNSGKLSGGAVIIVFPFLSFPYFRLVTEKDISSSFYLRGTSIHKHKKKDQNKRKSKEVNLATPTRKNSKYKSLSSFLFVEVC